MEPFSSWKDFDVVETTPIIKQYIELKSQHQDCIVFFQIGDFFEIFFDDSIVSSKILGLALTRKAGGGGKYISMCGVPVHSYETYIGRLVKAGYKIAICEQKETPAQAKLRGSKALVAREVSRIITNGTLIEESLLDNSTYNYLACIYFEKKSFTLAWIDISTGDFFYEEDILENLNNLLVKINPKEILIPDSKLDFAKKQLPLDFHNFISLIPAVKYNKTSTLEILNTSFTNQKHFLQTMSVDEIIVCGVLIDYVFLTQRNTGQLFFPQKKNEKSFLRIDAFTRKSLEILVNSSGEKSGSFKAAIDNTITNIGSRQLNFWLSNPLIDEVEINNRLEVVDYFIKNKDLLQEVRNTFKLIPDFERALSRVFFNKASVLDLLNIKNALNLLISVKGAFFNKQDLSDMIKQIIHNLGYYNNLIVELDNAIKPDITIRDKLSGFLKKGYEVTFDKLKVEKLQLVNSIHKLQDEYIFKLKIPNLKIVHNSIQGYSVEVSNKNSQQLLNNEEFKHKQSLASFTRYTTEILSKIEAEISLIDGQLSSLEKEVFKNLCDLVINKKDELFKTIKALGTIDILSSFADSAIRGNFCKPIINSSYNFNIKKGRHVVVENFLKKNSGENFIANDCEMDAFGNIFLITGPNMSGKSTYLRQNALIIIMAQMGSFVPAYYAEIGIVDAIFSRVGASDDISKGQSTFMLEMLELSTILNYATERSYLILDEIGRGTATYDGLSIAWATLEYLNNVIKARVLFATHYHELTQLEYKLSNLQCYYVEIKEHKDTIVFIHSLQKGYISKSYGIEVGKIAGMPQVVIDRAKEVLASLEGNVSLSKPYQNNAGQILPPQNLEVLETQKQKFLTTENCREIKDTKFENIELQSNEIVNDDIQKVMLQKIKNSNKIKNAVQSQAEFLFAQEETSEATIEQDLQYQLIIDNLSSLDIDNMSPKEALETIYSLQNQIKVINKNN